MSEPVLFTDRQSGKQYLLSDKANLDKPTMTISDPNTGDMFMVRTAEFLAEHEQGSGRRRLRRRKGGGR